METKFKFNVGFQFIFSFLVVILSAIGGFQLADLINPGLWYNPIISNAIAITVGLIIGILISRSYDKAISQLELLTKKISNGDLSFSPHFKRIFDDEIRGLFHSLIKMKTSMQEMIQGIQQISFHVGKMSGEILSSTENISSIAEEIQTSTANMVKKAEEQLVIFDNILESLNIIEANIRENSNKVTGTMDLSDRIGEKSKLSLSGIETTIDQLKRVLIQMESSSSAVINLIEKVQETEELIEILEEVTRKTDILAVNAAIEATKAGEYGEGISVIAEEIRHLAESAKKSTQNITRILEEIKTQSSTVRGSVKEVSANVKAGEENIDRTYQEIGEISGNIDTLTANIKEIGVSILSEEKIIGEITDKLKETSNIAEQTTFSLNEISTGIIYENEHLSKIYEEVKNLNSQTLKLTELTSRFKV